MPVSETAILRFQRGLLDRGYNDRTRKSYLSLVSKFAGFVHENFPEWKPFADSKQDKMVVENYNDYLREGQQLKASSTNAALSAVARFFSIEGHSRRFRLQQAPNTAEPEYLSSEEIDQLKGSLHRSSIKHQCIVMLFLAAGLRPQEVSSLHVSDVDLENCHLYVRQAGAERTISLTPGTIELLRKWYSERERSGDANVILFANSDGHGISGAGLDFIVKSVGQQARICLSARLLRNTYIKTLLSDGTDVPTVSRLAGFKNLSSIWRYIGT